MGGYLLVSCMCNYPKLIDDPLMGSVLCLVTQRPFLSILGIQSALG